MKVLIIFTTKLHQNGISNNVMNYIKYIDKKDLQIDIVSLNIVKEKYIIDIISEANCHLYELTMRNKNPIKYFFELIKIIRTEKYDIVHAHGNSATLSLEMLAARLGGTSIRIAHSRNTSCTHKFLDKLLRPLFNVTYTHGFACGKEAGEWLFKNREFTIIPNGNDTDKFKFNSNFQKYFKEKYHLQNKIVLGSVGTLTKQKNTIFIIEIMKELVKKNDNYVLFLFGEGPLRENIEKLISDYHLENNIYMMGRINYVSDILNAMDLMIFPSIYEGFPNVVIEWQINGVPALISDTITQTCILTDLVIPLPINQGCSIWVENILSFKKVDRNNCSLEAIKAVRDKGFDIKENANYLKTKYIELLKEEGRI